MNPLIHLYYESRPSICRLHNLLQLTQSHVCHKENSKSSRYCVPFKKNNRTQPLELDLASCHCSKIYLVMDIKVEIITMVVLYNIELVAHRNWEANLAMTSKSYPQYIQTNN